MKATGVIARFVSLLDIVLVLLGLLMIVLTQTQPQTPSQAADDLGAAAADVEFIYLVAGFGPRQGRVYLLGPGGRPGKEIQTDNSEEIDRLRNMSPNSNQIFVLMYSKDGWFAEWDDARRAALDKAWKASVVHIYNVELPDNP